MILSERQIEDRKLFNEKLQSVQAMLLHIPDAIETVKVYDKDLSLKSVSYINAKGNLMFQITNPLTDAAEYYIFDEGVNDVLHDDIWR